VTAADRERKIDAGQRKTQHKRLKPEALKKVAAADKQMTGDKSRKIDAREQRAETTPLKQTTKGGTRKAEIKERKRKVTN
jgi:hypothetical protein